MMGPTEHVVSGVIAYNGDSERGWNDPPTLSFVGASKKASKLDLRKRVSHQEALTGRKITSPSNQNTPNLYNQTNQISNGLSSPVMAQQPACQPVQSGVSPTISPCHSRHSSGSFTPPLTTEYPSPTVTSPTTQVPPQYPVQSLVSSQPSSIDRSSKNYVLHSQVPQFSSVQATATTTAPIKISSPVSTAPPPILGQPLFSFPKSFNMTPVSKALDSSHVRSHPDLVLDSSQDSQNSLNGNQPSKNTLAIFPSEVVPTPLIFTPSPTSANGFTSLPNDIIRKRSPVLNRTYKSNSVPSLHTPPGNKSPISTPTGVHSAGNSPRSGSPACGCRSYEASQDNSETFDSQEVMKVTVEALEETIIKCSDILKNREIEDMKKKLAIMKQQWQDEKLSLPVKITMKTLAKALLDADTQTAHKLHLHLMVDYVGEVKQWMVAIKRLISAIGNLHMQSTPPS